VQAGSGEAADAAAVTPFDFDALFRAEYPRIVRAIARVTGDPSRAEELAVEAFWRLSRHPRAHTPLAAGWVYRTAVRLGIDELRRRARRERYERWVLHAVRRVATPHDVLTAGDEQRRVRRVLASMSRKQAALLLLSGDDAAYRELADTLSMNPASVGTLLRRAKAVFEREYVRRYGTPSR
jgi:RNA polymerase sigma-70 factor (ECF subfamily)